MPFQFPLKSYQSLSLSVALASYGINVFFVGGGELKRLAKRLLRSLFYKAAMKILSEWNLFLTNAVAKGWAKVPTICTLHGAKCLNWSNIDHHKVFQGILIEVSVLADCRENIKEIKKNGAN